MTENSKTFSRAIRASKDYLLSREALESLRRDPYWPKYDSPWWHMVLLWELSLAAEIPQSAAEALADSINARCLRDFLPSELPKDVNRSTDMLCFCGAGIIEQVLRACGVDMPSRLGWMLQWPLRYQLEDGGLNCDEAAYAGSRKSSFLSTIAALEAVVGRPNLSKEEILFLDGGARYLLDRRLFRSMKGQVINEGWLTPRFPRFYDYDVLRGLRFLKAWSNKLGRPLPADAVAEARVCLKKTFPTGEISSQPPPCLQDKTLTWDGSRMGPGGPSARFPLLELSARPGPNAVLTAEWESDNF